MRADRQTNSILGTGPSTSKVETSAELTIVTGHSDIERRSHGTTEQLDRQTSAYISHELT